MCLCVRLTHAISILNEHRLPNDFFFVQSTHHFFLKKSCAAGQQVPVITANNAAWEDKEQSASIVVFLLLFDEMMSHDMTEKTFVFRLGDVGKVSLLINCYYFPIFSTAPSIKKNAYNPFHLSFFFFLLFLKKTSPLFISSTPTKKKE